MLKKKPQLDYNSRHVSSSPSFTSNQIYDFGQSPPPFLFWPQFHCLSTNEKEISLDDTQGLFQLGNQSINIYLFSTYYVPETLLCVGNRLINKIDLIPPFIST